MCTFVDWFGQQSADQARLDPTRQVLGGSGHLNQLAQAAGMSEEEAANDLADILPDLVNQLTPQGSIPDGGADIQALLRKMMG